MNSASRTLPAAGPAILPHGAAGTPARIQMATTTKPNDLAELAVHLARALPALSAHSAAALAAELCALERKVRRDAEAECNEPRTEKQVERARLAIIRARDRWLYGAMFWSRMIPSDAGYSAAALSAAAREGVRIELGGDPRGCVLLLHLPGHAEPIRV